MPSDPLRRRYEADVGALREAVSRRLDAGLGEEAVARWVVAERNALKERYRGLTPAAVLARIVPRTVQSYGSLDGPTADQLRARGKSWAEIIDSATRPGNHGDAFFLGDDPH